MKERKKFVTDFIPLGVSDVRFFYTQVEEKKKKQIYFRFARVASKFIVAAEAILFLAFLKIFFFFFKRKYLNSAVGEEFWEALVKLISKPVIFLNTLLLGVETFANCQ